MRIIDVLMALPFTILVIVIMTILGQGLQNVYIALWVVGWMAYARLVRGEVLVLKNSEFIQSAVISGYSDARVLMRHLLPNVISAAVVFAASDVVLCMLTGASMSYWAWAFSCPRRSGVPSSTKGVGTSPAWWITFFPAFSWPSPASVLAFRRRPDGLPQGKGR
jgi:peptide/nickel transport system permease protein